MGFQTMADKCRGKLLPKSMRKTDSEDGRIATETESMMANQYPIEREDYRWAAARGRGIGSASREAQDRYQLELASRGRGQYARRNEPMRKMDSSDERDYIGSGIKNERGVISASNLKNKQFREAYKKEIFKRMTEE